MIDLAQINRLWEIWSTKPDSLLANEAMHTLMALVPEWVQETKEQRLILERTRPQAGW